MHGLHHIKGLEVEFNKLIINHVYPILLKYKYRIVDQAENFVKFQSKKLTIMISYDFQEKLRMLSIGRNEKSMFLLDGNLIKKFLIPQLDQVFIIPEITEEDFIKNLITLFEGNGQQLINGDAELLWEIEKYVRISSEEYTREILISQNLKDADEAWMIKDYKGFISVMDKMDIIKLSKSWQFKYKMAKKYM